MLGQPVARLRRWGVGWRNILKCFIGLHRGYVLDRALVCARCGRVMVAARSPKPLQPED